MNDYGPALLRARLLAARSAHALDALAAFPVEPHQALVELDTAEAGLLRAVGLVRQLRQSAGVVAQSRALEPQREGKNASSSRASHGWTPRRKGGDRS